MKKLLTGIILSTIIYSSAFATALQIDALWSGINNPTTGKSYSGAIVATFASGTTTPKAVWEDKDQTLPSALGKAQFTLDSNGQAFVYGDGVYKINIYAPTDTGLTTPLITIDGATYTVPGGTGTGISLNDVYDCDLSDALTDLGAIDPATLAVDCDCELDSGESLTQTKNIELLHAGGTIDGVIGGSPETLATNGIISVPDGVQFFGDNLELAGTPIIPYVSVNWVLANTVFGTTDVGAGIQKAIDWANGIPVKLLDQIYATSVGLTSSVEGQIIEGTGKSNRSTIIALADIIVLTFQTERHQFLRHVTIDGDSLASYGVKLNFPKTGLDFASVYNCNDANVHMGYFSTYIQDSIVMFSNGTGILMQDSGGPINDLRVFDSIVSGNAKDGILINSSNRDGIYLRGLNMESNASTAGYSAINVARNVNSFSLKDSYFEDGGSNAGNYFVYLSDSQIKPVIENCKFSDSSVTNMDYFIKVGTSGAMSQGTISNCWAGNYGVAFVENNLTEAYTNSLILDNNTIVGGNAFLASSGSGLEIRPRRSVLNAVTEANFPFGTGGTDLVFNIAAGSGSQSTVSGRLAPADFSLTTGQYTCFESGQYRITYNLNTALAGPAPPASGTYFTVEVFIDTGGGFAAAANTEQFSETADGVKPRLSASGTVVLDLQYGDKIKLVGTTSTGSLDMRANESSMSIEKIGGHQGQ